MLGVFEKVFSTSVERCDKRQELECVLCQQYTARHDKRVTPLVLVYGRAYVTRVETGSSRGLEKRAGIVYRRALRLLC